jgi:hypothetical protein
MAETEIGMSTDNIKGLVLALSSSLFIGASFIVKKKGLKTAGASGIRAGKVSIFLLFIQLGFCFWPWNGLHFCGFSLFICWLWWVLF